MKISEFYITMLAPSSYKKNYVYTPNFEVGSHIYFELIPADKNRKKLKNQILFTSPI